MFFKLINALISFQIYVDSILEDMTQKQVMIFLNDIIIMKQFCKELQQNILKVLKHLQTTNLYIKLKKCYFEITEISFLEFNLLTYLL